ncbi:MAG: FAD:protein FMN transferase [Gammaproteobacteria bacterium]|nr:MAG: FAD:protein FMN transferase [Gammaproteobacteria bacterium]
MRPARRTFPLAVLLVLVLAGCQKPHPEVRRTFLALGTLVEVSLYDVPPARAARLLDAVEADFRRRHHDWHAWEESPVTRLNRAFAAGRCLPVPKVVAPLLGPATRLAVASDHLFNPAIGRLIALWGFHAERYPDHPPPAARIRALVAARPRMTDLYRDAAGRLCSRNPAVALDFGGFAKGWAIGEVARLLRRGGAHDAVIDAGGDLQVLGRHGDRPWRIGIRDPQRRGAVLGAVEVADGECVFTSGSYERFFVWHGRRYHHLIDPRTGYPATGALSVTVIATDPALADAAATALFVAGAGHWPAIARRLGVTQVLLVAPDGTLEASPAMARRLRRLAPERTLHVLAETPAASRGSERSSR